MEKTLMFVILQFASMDRGQAARDYFVNLLPGVFPMKGACKKLKRILLTATVFGVYGEERVVVQRLEINGTVCPVSPPSHETAIDIDHTPLQTAPTIPDVGEGDNDSSRKVDGGAVERGGGWPGDGGADPGGEGPDGNSNTDGDSDGDDNERNGQDGEFLSRLKRKTLNKLAKISISIAAQTGIALVALPRDKPTFIVYLVVVISACSYFFCFLSIMSEKQSAAAITAAIGTLLAAVGFLLTMCIIVLPFSVWAFVLSCLILFISIVLFIVT